MTYSMRHGLSSSSAVPPLNAPSGNEDEVRAPAEPALRRRSLAASALLHAAVLATLIGLRGAWPAPE
ncbi:MAG TPA: hypothetical protein VF502_04780, partial [Stellaceae bacterium]